MTSIMLSRYDGHVYDALRMTPTDMPIEHIAHNLSYINRYGGAQPTACSVAAHSLLVSYLVSPEYEYEALMHDATEAVVGDLSSEIKKLCPDYRRIELRVREQLSEFYGFPLVESDEVKYWDVKTRDVECWTLREPDPEFKSSLFICSAREIKVEFLDRYHELRGAR